MHTLTFMNHAEAFVEGQKEENIEEKDIAGTGGKQIETRAIQNHLLFGMGKRRTQHFCTRQYKFSGSLN